MRKTEAFDNFMMGYYNENYGISFTDFCESVAEFMKYENNESIKKTRDDLSYIIANVEIPTMNNINNYKEHSFWRKYHIILYKEKIEYFYKTLESWNSGGSLLNP